MPDSDVIRNFKTNVFYHGTSLVAAESIVQQGFSAWTVDDELGRVRQGDNLGPGIYMTCDWRIALFFGPTLLRVGVRPGTRFLNAAIAPDAATLRYLQKEFGRDVLKKTPWRVIPRNKDLRLKELICLFRYHYSAAWGTTRARKDRPFAAKKWEAQLALLRGFLPLLRRYGFHGYGNPHDDNGIVVFAEDRLVVREVIAEIAESDYQLWKDPIFQTLDEVRAHFKQFGTRRTMNLAKRVAARSASQEI